MAEFFVIRDAAVACPKLYSERKPKKAHVSGVNKSKKKQGVDVESFDCEGRTPLDVASTSELYAVLCDPLSDDED